LQTQRISANLLLVIDGILTSKNGSRRLLQKSSKKGSTGKLPDARSRRRKLRRKRRRSRRPNRIIKRRESKLKRRPKLMVMRD